MSRINELSEEQRNILDSLYWMDATDEEDAENIEYLNRKLGEIRGNAQNTILFLHGLWLEARAVAEARKQAKLRAEKRQKTAEGAETRLKNRIIELCEEFGLTKVIDEETGAGVRTQVGNGSLVYDHLKFDINSLPDEMKRVVPEHVVAIDAEVKKALKEGIVIEGAEIVKNLGIRVV